MEYPELWKGALALSPTLSLPLCPGLFFRYSDTCTLSVNCPNYVTLIPNLGLESTFNATETLSTIMVDSVSSAIVTTTHMEGPEAVNQPEPPGKIFRCYVHTIGLPIMMYNFLSK